MTVIMPDSAVHRPVTALPAYELERIVYAAQRPCIAPGADPEDWFSDAEPGLKAHARYEDRARALCRGCPVAIECLELAIVREGPVRGHGISGGTAPWQRQQIKASRGWAVRRG
jgi:hypothetical protein